MGTPTPHAVFSVSDVSGGESRMPSPALDLMDLLESEKRTLDRIAQDADLKTVLGEIAGMWERHSTHFSRCALFTANAAGDCLDLATAPNLPEEYKTLHDHTQVGPDSNACGVASWNKQPLLLEDAAADERFGTGKDVLFAFGMRAGWVEPILSSRGRLLGALAAYSTEPAGPSAHERMLMERLKHFTRIAVERDYTARDIERLSRYDVLTGLPNRSSLLHEIDGALLAPASEFPSIVVLLFGLNAMKQINETLGYEFGSRCIQEIAGRMRGHLAGHRIFARVEGDEFGMMLEGGGDEAALESVAQDLLAAISQPLRIDGHDVFLTASLGMSVSPRDGADADALFKHADAALHRAKQLGRNCFCFYTPDMDAASVRHLKLLGELRRAVEHGEFDVHYQPQVDIASGRISGAEALLRWESPKQGPVPPSEFVPLLEETGLILTVGEWVLARVCRDLARLEAAGLEVPRVAVNLSARQFLQQDLVEQVERLLAAHRVPAERLMLEITETLLMQDPGSAMTVLRRLKAIRVGVALDDFGTGYSSLGYLKHFPVDELKVDKSFVAGVTESQADAAITDAVIRLAHNLGIKVVAEGVENEAQLAFLKQHGCDLSQGFLTGRPVEFDAFRSVLAHPKPSVR